MCEIDVTDTKKIRENQLHCLPIHSFDEKKIKVLVPLRKTPCTTNYRREHFTIILSSKIKKKKTFFRTSHLGYSQ